MFWGNTARHHRGSSKSDNGQKAGLWVFDPNEPLPEGVICNYGTHEPIYTGNLAEQVKAELRRRRLVFGINRPYRSGHFSGLMICGECGYTLSFTGKKDAPVYRCATRHSQEIRHIACHQHEGIPLWRVQRWLDTQFEQMLKEDNPNIFLPRQEDAETRLKERISYLTKEIQAKHAGIARLIQKQARVDDVSLEAMYDEQILVLNQEIKNLKESLALAQNSLPNADIKRSQERSFEQIKLMSLDKFWDLSSVEVNQILHRLFGNKRLVVLDAQIVGIQVIK